MQKHFLYFFFLFLSFKSLAQKEAAFAFSTSYNAAAYTKPVKIYPGSVLKADPVYIQALQLSAKTLYLPELEKLQTVEYVILDNTVTSNSYYIDSKGLESLFHSLALLDNLHYISLEDPKLLPYLASLKHLKGLKLNGFDATLFAKALPALSNLEVLIIQDALITTLPESIGEITSLRQLQIDCLNLTNLPSTIGQLQNLLVFVMQTGKIKELPDSFGNLIHLKYVSCTGANAYKKFPLELTKLVELETLIIELKLLNDIPLEIGNLTNLRILELLEARKLYRLPESLSRLTKLEQFYLSDAMDLGGDVGPLLFIKQPFTLILNRCAYSDIANTIKGDPYITCLVMPSTALPSEIKKVTLKLGSSKVCLKNF